MLKSFLLALALLLSLSSLACTDYSTGLRQSAGTVDETAVISTMQTIATAQRTYAVSNNGDYGTFPQLCAAGVLDERFNSNQPEVRGYVLTMNVSEQAFSCNADPAPSGKQQAARHFYVDSTSAVPHANPTQPASATDPPVN
jgi:hypothetical protein